MPPEHAPPFLVGAIGAVAPKTVQVPSTGYFIVPSTDLSLPYYYYIFVHDKGGGRAGGGQGAGRGRVWAPTLLQKKI